MSEIASPPSRPVSATPINCTTTTNTQIQPQQNTTHTQQVSQRPSITENQSSSTTTSSTSSAASSSSLSSSPAIPKSCLLRLQSDYKSLESDPPEGVSASPIDSDFTQWKACIFGPSDSEWEGGIFQMLINFPKDYPQKPPTIRFISKIFHPNIFNDGSLCLDIIQDHWSPIHTVSTILTSIQSLLTDPNPASPANPEAAKLWASDKKEYRKRVRACVAKSAQQ